MSTEEIQAIIDAPDLATWNGLRDHAMFTALYNTGVRVSEVTGMKISDLSLGSGSIRIHGKGRKQRVMPRWQSTVKLLKNWLTHVNRDAESPLFLSPAI